MRIFVPYNGNVMLIHWTLMAGLWHLGQQGGAWEGCLPDQAYLHRVYQSSHCCIMALTCTKGLIHYCCRRTWWHLVGVHTWSSWVGDLRWPRRQSVWRSSSRVVFEAVL